MTPRKWSFLILWSVIAVGVASAIFPVIEVAKGIGHGQVAIHYRVTRGGNPLVGARICIVSDTQHVVKYGDCCAVTGHDGRGELLCGLPVVTSRNILIRETKLYTVGVKVVVTTSTGEVARYEIKTVMEKFENIEDGRPVRLLIDFREN